LKFQTNINSLQYLDLTHVDSKQTMLKQENSLVNLGDST